MEKFLQLKYRELRTENLIKKALRAKNETTEAIQKIAEEVYKYDWTLTPNAPISEQLMELNIIDMSMVVLRTKIYGVGATIGPKATLGINGLISVALLREMVRHNQYKRDDIDYLDRSLKMLKGVNEHVYALQFRLQQLLIDVVALSEYAGRMNKMTKFMSIMNKVYDVKDLNDHIAGSIVELRRYGVKPAIFADGILHSADQAWFMQPAPPEIPATLAITGLSPRSNLTDLLPKHAELPGLKGYQLIPTIVNFMIGTDGELHQGNGLTSLSTREFLRDNDAEELYEFLRLFPLIRLYDLVVPIETVRQMPPWPGTKLGPSGLSRALKAIPNLLLPRLRTLDYLPDLEMQLEQEVSMAEQQTSQRAKRRHGVVGHVRVLPAGKTATLEAKQRALDELGIVLAPNETYVRSHQRGSGQMIKAHEAKLRSRR